MAHQNLVAGHRQNRASALGRPRYDDPYRIEPPPDEPHDVLRGFTRSARGLENKIKRITLEVAQLVVNGEEILGGQAGEPAPEVSGHHENATIPERGDASKLCLAFFDQVLEAELLVQVVSVDAQREAAPFLLYRHSRRIREVAS